MSNFIYDKPDHTDSDSGTAEVTGDWGVSAASAEAQGDLLHTGSPDVTRNAWPTLEGEDVPVPGVEGISADSEERGNSAGTRINSDYEVMKDGKKIPLKFGSAAATLASMMPR